MEALQRAFEADPQNIKTGLQLATEALSAGQMDQALAVYDRLLDVAPTLVDAHFGRGVALQRLGREADAIEAYRAAFENDGPHGEAGLRLADMLLASGNVSAALETFGRVLQIAPGLSEAHFGCGLALRRLGRNGDAIDEFRKAFENARPHTEAGLGLADLLFREGDIVGAFDAYGRVLEIAPGLREAHYGRAAAAQRLGRHADAIADFRRAFDAEPPHLEAGLKLAEALLAMGDAGPAIELFDQILRSTPAIAEAHYGRGVSALKLGRIEDAKLAFRRALELNPGYPAAASAYAFLSSFSVRSKPNTRLGRRPVICLPLLPFARDWLGGQIYVLNFARILSLLPKHRRPRLLVAIFVDDWRDVKTLGETVAALAGCPAVIGAFDAGRRTVFSTPFLDRYLRYQRRASNGSVDGIARLLERVEFTFPMLYPCWGVGDVGQPLFWIPDLQHRFFPGNFTAEEISARDQDMSALAMRNVPVIFSSFDAESHFKQFFPNQRCHTYVWHFRSLPDADEAPVDASAYESLGLPERFYYTPNQFWPHKDHLTLFKSLRLILDSGRDVTFVCTGSDISSSADPYARELLKVVEELQLGPHLRLIGVLPRALQLEVMRRACAVIQPSLFEGWSTVVEDARMLGRPLIVSDIPVHREQVGPGGRFFTARDPASLAAAVVAVDGDLVPGPDPAREAAAGLELERQAETSANEFVAILQAEWHRQAAPEQHPALPPASDGFLRSLARSLTRRLPPGAKTLIHRAKELFRRVTADPVSELRLVVWKLRHPFRSRIAPDALRPAMHRLVGHWRAMTQPQLFQLAQYAPRPLRLPEHYQTEMALENTPRIGIVTPSFNCAAYLPATIESVISQRYPNLAYTVQDGGSSDGTLELLGRLDSRVSWRSEPDCGQADAINRGFARIDAEIMGYLNSDDILLPHSLAYVARFFARHPDVDAIYGHRIMIDEAGHEIGRWLLPNHDPEAIKWADFIPQETMFWRRRVWDAVGSFDETFSYALDWDFILRAQAAGFRFWRVPRFLAAFRIHSAQKTTSSVEVGNGEMARLRQTHLGRVPDSHEIDCAIRKYIRRHAVVYHLHRLKVIRS